jgi:acetyl esterase/lipase
MLDDRTASRPDPRPAVRRLWNNRANRFGWSSYLGQQPGGPGVSPHAAPGRCTDFAGLPPAWIGVGTNDLFHDEAVAYARGLHDAGIPCELDIVPGAFHGFEAAGPARPVVAEWYDRQIGALNAALND